MQQKNRLEKASKLILHPQVISHIGLAQNNDAIGIQLPAILRRLRGDTETQRHIRHGKYNNPVAGGDVLRDSAQLALQNVVSVQERLLRLRLEPYLVLGVGGEQVEGLDGEVEVAAVGVLADADADRY